MSKCTNCMRGDCCGGDFDELKAELAELRVVLAQARKAADAAGTYTLWSCGEVSASRQVGRLKEAIKEFDALQEKGE